MFLNPFIWRRPIGSITRRSLLVNGGLSLCAMMFHELARADGAAAVPPTLPTTNQLGTCLNLLSGAGSAGSGPNINGQLDNVTLGLLVQDTINSVARRFAFDKDRLPGLQYAHGPREQDAWVENVTYVDGTENTVILGSERLKSESANDIHYGGIGIALVIAHEMTHVHQIETNAVDQVRKLTDRYIRILELHADWLAGWYLGLDSSWTQNFMDYASRRIQSWGDSCVDAVNHHGFGSERQFAMYLGWLRATRPDRVGFAEESAYAMKNVSDYVLTVPAGTSVCLY